MEIIVRIAIVKYKDSGIVETYSEAVSMMMDQIAEEINRPLFDYQSWRDKFYWTERCDLILKKYKHLLEFFFQKYSGAKTKPGQKNFMSLDEFKSLCSDGGLLENESM